MTTVIPEGTFNFRQNHTSKKAACEFSGAIICRENAYIPDLLPP